MWYWAEQITGRKRNPTGSYFLPFFHFLRFSFSPGKTPNKTKRRVLSIPPSHLLHGSFDVFSGK
jgi:hypothetical protein